MYERNRKLKIRIGCFGVLLAVMMTCIVLGVFSFQASEIDESLLRGGWTVTVREEKWEDVDLDSVFFPVTNSGDLVVMERVLPDAGVEHPVLRLLSIHSVVEVWLDGEEIYTYGRNRADDGKMVGYGYHFVELPDQYAGKTLVIRCEVTEDDAFSSLTVPTVSSGNEAVTDLLSRYKIPLLIDIFLMIFGISLLFVTGIMSVISDRIQRVIWVAWFACLIGIWNLCSYHLLQLFTPSLSLCALLEYISIYTAPLLLLRYFREDVERTGVKLMKYLYYVIICFQSLFCVTSMLLHFLNVAHLPVWVKINQISCVVMIVFVLLVQIYNVRKKRLLDKVVLSGMVVVICFAGIDMICYNLQKYISAFRRADFNGFMSIGVLLLVLILFAGFYMDVINNLREEEWQKLMEKQAYTDALTSIANRRCCEEEMERLSAGGEKVEFSVLNLDLNGLKQANDAYGHEEGDYLISTFAHVLKEIFSPVGLVGRMGGDEFAVIMRDIDREACEPYIRRMEEMLKELNAAGGHSHISTSYGFAASAECPSHDAREVYRLADSRMYAYKKEYKERLAARRKLSDS